MEEITLTEFDGFTKKLYPHQKECIDKMIVIENKEFKRGNHDFMVTSDDGILTERDGSGKSLIILGLIQSTLLKEPKKYKIQRGAFSYFKKEINKIFINISVIVYPEYLKTHWKNEISTTSLRHNFIHYPKDLNRAIDDIDVLFISLSRIKDINLDEFIFNRVIIDEADTCLFSRKFPEGYFTWYITPRFEELSKRKPFANVSVDELCFITVKSSFDPRKDYPIFVKEYKYFSGSTAPFDIEQSELFLVLKDYREAILFLEGIVITPKALEKLVIKTVGEKLQDFSHMTEQEISELNLDDFKKKIETRFESIKEKFQTFKTQSCPICLETISHPTMVSCCNTFYCAECIAKWFITNIDRCPMCREVPQLYKVEDVIPKEKSKAQVCADIIQENTGRFLIYIEDFQSFDEIQILFGKLKISYNIFTSKSDKLMTKCIDQYNNEPGKQVLLIFQEHHKKSILYGVGLSKTNHFIVDSKDGFNNIKKSVIRLGRDLNSSLTGHILKSTRI